jgi:hypothetical protein
MPNTDHPIPLDFTQHGQEIPHWHLINCLARQLPGNRSLPVEAMSLRQPDI